MKMKPRVQEVKAIITWNRRHNNWLCFWKFSRAVIQHTDCCNINNRRESSHSPSWLWTLQPGPAIKQTAVHQSAHVEPNSNFALPGPVQRNYWLMAHWVWLRHHWLPENIKALFHCSDDRLFSLLCHKERNWGRALKEQGKGGEETETLMALTKFLLTDVWAREVLLEALGFI